MYPRITKALFALMVLCLLVTPNAFAHEGDRKEPDPTLGDSPAGEKASLELAFDDKRAVADDSAVKRAIPPVDIVVDGKRLPAKAISKFDGKPLNFVMNEKAEKEGVIYAFTSRKLLKAYLQKENAMPSVNPPANEANGAQHLSWEYWSYVFEDSYYGGKYLYKTRGYGYRNLADIKRRCYILWCDSWDNAISSVMTTSNGKTVLYSGPYYSGSTFTFYGHIHNPNLNWNGSQWAGWNDVTSSMFVFW